MMSESDDCLFCKIIAGQIPSSKVYEDETGNGLRIQAVMADPEAGLAEVVVTKNPLQCKGFICARDGT